jgi:hypothetical protein
MFKETATPHYYSMIPMRKINTPHGRQAQRNNALYRDPKANAVIHILASF